MEAGTAGVSGKDVGVKDGGVIGIGHEDCETVVVSEDDAAAVTSSSEGAITGEIGEGATETSIME